MQRWQFCVLILCLSSVSLFTYSGETSFTREIMGSTTTERPTYLYKILSYRHWQASEHKKTVVLPAEDDAFIHFSTEDQLGITLEKYWADAPQYVVLKIDTAKLKGDLVYEANPGRSTKYYHLYNGCIPFGSVIEARVAFRESANTNVCCGHTLDIVQVGDPVLRKPARELSREEILSPEIQKLIEDMKATMRAAPGVGLAAPQIGQPLQLIVVEDVDHTHLTAEQLLERDRYSVPFHVIINPKMYIENEEIAEFFEGCLSVPGLVGVVPRAKYVRVECFNERAEPVVIEAKGWYARILQHEIDHVHAVLYLDRSVLPSVMTEENYIKCWKGKTVREVLDSLTLPSAR